VNKLVLCPQFSRLAILLGGIPGSCGRERLRVVAIRLTLAEEERRHVIAIGLALA
jgi:hypothetical protein